MPAGDGRTGEDMPDLGKELIENRINLAGEAGSDVMDDHAELQVRLNDRGGRHDSSPSMEIDYW